jgi:uncharacterized protein YjbI with pentapeptide repeats
MLTATSSASARSVGHTKTRSYAKMKRTVTALTLAATMFASSASAFDPDDRQKLKDTGECEECDLSGAVLAWADLEGANLGGANLEYANMNGAILCNTTMPNKFVIYSGC